LISLLRIPESPKYLYTNRKFDEARSALKWIAAMNGKKASDVDSIEFDLEVDYSITTDDNEE